MTQIDLAFSPCPNDTFIFHAMLHDCIDTAPFAFRAHVHDVETLNLKAADATFHVTKLSFFAYMRFKDNYALLDAGAALGYGCGPLLVARSRDISLTEARIAVPGAHTTAHLLLRLWNPAIQNVELTRFDHILPGIESGEYDAGVIIHEGRFVYPTYNCVKVADLGEWWEAETGMPIPLGCIAVRKDVAALGHKEDIERILRESVQYAFDNHDASRAFVKAYAKEMDDEAVNSHIQLYVNDFTLSLGDKGRIAAEKLEDMARCRGIL